LNRRWSTKSLVSLALTVGLLANAASVPAWAADPGAGGATYFTDTDNWGGYGSGSPDNDLDNGNPRIKNGDAKYPIEFKIEGVDKQPQKSAQLLVRAYDVDEYDGSSGTGEWDRIYFSSNPANLQLGAPYTPWPGSWGASANYKKELREEDYVGALSGNDERWNTTVLTVDPAAITAGSSDYYVGLTTHHYFKAPNFNSGWVVEVDWGQLLIDGGVKETAELTQGNMRIVNGKMVVDTGFMPKTSGHFAMEVSLIEKVADTDGNVVEQNLDTVSKRFLNTPSGDEKVWSGIELGSNLDPTKEYTVNIILFDDRGGQVTADNPIDPGKAEQIYMASTLKDIAKTGPQFDPTPFTADDFKNKYAKIDNTVRPDLLQKVRIETLPDTARGQLMLDDGTSPAAAVTAGQEIDVQDLDYLKFVPAPGANGFTGSASFKWNGSDGAQYALFNADVTITANAAPTIDPITKAVNKGSNVVFSLGDFTGTKYTDPEHAPLDHIRIGVLPDAAIGKLFLGVTEVTYGQEIPASILGQLTFVPETGKSGTVTFDWNGSDGVQYAPEDKTVTIVINSPPVVRDIVKTGLANEVISFSSSDFAGSPAYTDADADALAEVNLSLPGSFGEQGTLWYTSVSGTTYMAPGSSKSLSPTELDSLKFKPAPNLANGSSISFPWIGNDGKQDAEASALVNIVYNGIPVAHSLEKASDEETPAVLIVLKGTDMETVTGLVYGIAAQPSRGTLTPAGDDNPDGNRWFYTPNPGFTGEDSFTYTVTDADGQHSVPAVVTIHIHKLLDGWAGNKNQGDTTQVKVLPGQTVQLSAVSRVDAAEVTALVNGTAVPLTLANSTTYITDGFKQWVTGTYKLPEDTQPGVYAVSFSAAAADQTALPSEPASRLGDNSFAVPQPAALQLTANPGSILGDGKSTAVLTATLKDHEGNPIAGTEVVFTAPDGAGSFVGPDRAVTDSLGNASVIYQSAKITGVTEQTITIPVTVLDIAKGVSAKGSVTVTFLPPTISGVITANDTHQPVAGATVRVTLDRNGDGRIEPGVDFDETVVTKEDGSYSIPVPEGDKEYNLEFTQNVIVGGVETPVTYSQKAAVGAASGTGDEHFDSEKTVTGIVLLEQQDGTSALFDSSHVGRMKVYLKDAAGNYISDNGVPKAFPLQNQGVFNVNGLTKDVEYSLEIRYEIEPGQEIIVKRSTVKVTADGEMNISQELIDPYGKITDAVTHSVIEGAQVVLYYADTQRNKDNGRTPNTGVVLPPLPGFPPNGNGSPDQLSDAGGLYAYMVYPNTDYYIVVTKPGYIAKTSDTISVDNEVVRQDFELTPVRRSSGHSSGGAAAPAAAEVTLNTSVDNNLIQEGGLSAITLDYKNTSAYGLGEGEVSVKLPDGAELADAGGGDVEGRTVTWKVTDLAAGQSGSFRIQVKWDQLPAADAEFEFPAQFTVNGSTDNPVTAASSVKVKVFSDRFGELKHQRYILGYPDGQFKPDRTLSRAELAAIIARLTENDELSDPIGYTDVPADHWAANYIKIVTKHGYFNGFEEGDFRPEAPVTRGELASVMTRFLQLNVSKSGEAHFTDVENHWAMDAIEELYRSHYLSGYPDGTFKPDHNMIRSEAVTLINRMLYRGPLQGLAPQFPDVSENHWAFGDVQEATVSHEAVRNADGSETWKSLLTDDVK